MLKAFWAIANRNNRTEICKNINKERINIIENSYIERISSKCYLTLLKHVIAQLYHQKIITRTN